MKQIRFKVEVIADYANVGMSEQWAAEDLVTEINERLQDLNLEWQPQLTLPTDVQIEEIDEED